MPNEGRWIYQTPKTRHGFSLCRVAEAGTIDERYDLLGVIEVTPDPLRPDHLNQQLHPWALATLQAGGFGFGRYYAAFSTLGEDSEPERPLAEFDIDWSGNTELVPASTTTALAPAATVLAPLSDSPATSS